MPCTEAYKEHIMYTFNGFCKTVIRFAAINAWRDRSRRQQKEISLEYLTEEKFYPLGTTDKYFEAPYEEYPITICGQTVILTNGELAAALLSLSERNREIIFLYFFGDYTQQEIGEMYGRCRSTTGYLIRRTLKLLQRKEDSIKQRLEMGLNDIHSLLHSKWNCKYHVVFAPKYRRGVFYGEKRTAIGKILRTLCEWKDVNIIEAEVYPDHVHMLLEILPKMKVPAFIGYLKGKSVAMIYEQFGELKHKYRNREFWCKGYYIDVTGKNTARIAEYIKHQLEEDQLGEQLSMPEVGQFKGRKRK